MEILHTIRNRQGFGATPVVLILIPLILLGGVFVFSYVRRARVSETPIVALRDNTSRDNLNVDSDGDGLKDWEEQIYGTNPHNPDTDGDGTNDGDEIALGRDPLKKGPNDTLTRADTSSAITAANTHATDQPNLTQKLAEVFGTDYLTNLVQNPDSPPDINAIADKMTQITLDESPSHAPLITANDIIISRNATKYDIANYLAQFDAALSSALKPLAGTKSITNTITDIVHTEDTARTSAAVDQLAKQVQAYDQFLDNIKKISVPEDFASLHVEYLNTAIRERNALKKIQNVKDDPVMTLMGLKEWGQTAPAFLGLRERYIQLAKSKGIHSVHP